MIVERCGQAWRHGIVAIAVAEGLLFWSSRVSAQSQSLLGQGVGAAMYGRCQTDVLSNDLLRSAAALGAAGGGAYWNRQQMNACINRQQQLDGMSASLTGSVPRLSLTALQALMVSNVQRRTISEVDADTLITEANKLSQRALVVFQAMR